MKIEIQKSEVYQEVEKQSSLVASSQSGGEQFEQLWASKYEWPMLDVYWVEGCTSVLQIFMRYVRNDSVKCNLGEYDSSEVFVIYADMPDGFNDSLIGSIYNSIKMLLVMNVLSGWFSNKLPELSAKYSTDAEGYSSDIRKKLLYRNIPFQNRANDGITTDTSFEDNTEYFSDKGEDTDFGDNTEYFSDKGEDTDFGDNTEYFSDKGEDTDFGDNTEYFSEKEKDNFNFNQYEKCCCYFTQKRNYE